MLKEYHEDPRAQRLQQHRFLTTKTKPNHYINQNEANQIKKENEIQNGFQSQMRKARGKNLGKLQLNHMWLTTCGLNFDILPT